MSPKLLNYIFKRFSGGSGCRSSPAEVVNGASLAEEASPLAKSVQSTTGQLTGSLPSNRHFHRVAADWCEGWAATVEKPNNDVLVADSGNLIARKNEDRFRLEGNAAGDVIAAIADGAGGEGLYCGNWAERLLAELPLNPIKAADALNDWLNGFCETFQSEFREHAKSDPVLFRKFVKEGSLATLSVVWITPGRTGARLSALFYGDSPVMLWNASNRNSDLQLLHPTELKEFLSDPYLLNWRTEFTPEKLHFVSDLDIWPGETIVIASDAIGQYLALRSLYGSDRHASTSGDMWREVEEIRLQKTNRLSKFAEMHRQMGISFLDEFSLLRRGFSSAEAFSNFVLNQFEQGLLANDDCTMIVVNVIGKKQTSLNDAF